MISTDSLRSGSADAATAATENLRLAAGDEVVAVLAFGSRVTGAGPDSRSAWDLFVVVETYRGFYGRCRRQLGWRRSARTLALLNRFLPPNVLHLPDADGPGAKLFVISEDDLAERLAGDTVDHFCRARLVQRVDLVHARDAAARSRMEALLERARHSLVEWMRPFLGRDFDAETFCREMLRVSYRTEVRPEAAGRADEVFSAQRSELAARYGRVLAKAALNGRILREGSGYRYPAPAGALARQLARWRLRGSKLRATVRWLKHVLTFDGWLDYIVAKTERRTGLRVEITTNERRLPLLLLWPKFVRVLHARRRPKPDGESVA